MSMFVFSLHFAFEMWHMNRGSKRFISFSMKPTLKNIESASQIPELGPMHCVCSLVSHASRRWCSVTKCSASSTSMSHRLIASVKVDSTLLVFGTWKQYRRVKIIRIICHQPILSYHCVFATHWFCAHACLQVYDSSRRNDLTEPFVRFALFRHRFGFLSCLQRCSWDILG